MTDRSAAKLDPVPDVLELDVNKPEDIEAVAADLPERWGRVDGILHAIAFAPGTRSAATSSTRRPRARSPRSTTSAFSLKALAVGLSDLFPEEGAAIVGLDFDAQVAWPVYDWMGVAKAALEATARYLARDLGPRRVRVNLVSRRAAGHAGRARHPRLQRPRRRPGRSRRRCRGTSRIRRRSRRRSTSCSATPRGRSPPRSSTSTAASTPWARRSRRCARRSRRESRRSS